MAGGVEHRQLRAAVPGRSKVREPAAQVGGSQFVCSLQIAPGVFGLHGEVPQIAGTLHQRAAHQCTARLVDGQSQFPGGGFGIEVAAVYKNAGGTAGEHSRITAQTTQQAVKAFVLTCIVQRDGEEKPPVLQIGDFLRLCDDPGVNALQRGVQNVSKPG